MNNKQSQEILNKQHRAIEQVLASYDDMTNEEFKAMLDNQPPSIFTEMYERDIPFFEWMATQPITNTQDSK